MYGARPLKRAIQQQIENPLATRILQGEFVPGDRIRVTAQDGELGFAKADAQHGDLGGDARAPPAWRRYLLALRATKLPGTSLPFYEYECKACKYILHQG